MNTTNKIRLLLIGILTAFVSVTTYAQNMSVTIKNVKDNAGTVRVAVYNSADRYMKQELQRVAVRAVQGDVVATFTNLAAGTYAISVIHDANDNHELDSNFLGMPKEGFGFSNNAMGAFGPPDFKKASFQFSGESPVVISLRYL